MSSTARRVALVTGSTDGLGRTVARPLAASGYQLSIHGRCDRQARRRRLAAPGARARLTRLEEGRHGTR